MRVEFIKMHGLGNDFVVLDMRASSMPGMTPAMARALADRHTGIGCDQLVLLGPAENADCAMRIFNQDGGEVQACGNATRAVGVLLGRKASISTAAGVLQVEPADNGIAVDMERVLDAAAEHGVALEINGDPRRLELDWRWVGEAADRGILLSLGPDAHGPETIEPNHERALWMARKGGLGPEHVLNTRGLDGLRPALRRNRS